MSETTETTLVGIPTMCLLPPKNFYFSVSEKKHKLTIPKKGNYYDIDKDYFEKDDGSFSIIDNEVINISAITKVLFGSKQYPDLKSNQLFCPSTMIVNKDTIDIFGQVVEMLETPTGMVV